MSADIETAMQRATITCEIFERLAEAYMHGAKSRTNALMDIDHYFSRAAELAAKAGVEDRARTVMNESYEKAVDRIMNNEPEFDLGKKLLLRNCYC